MKEHFLPIWMKSGETSGGLRWFLRLQGELPLQRAIFTHEILRNLKAPYHPFNTHQIRPRARECDVYILQRDPVVES